MACAHYYHLFLDSGTRLEPTRSVPLTHAHARRVGGSEAGAATRVAGRTGEPWRRCALLAPSAEEEDAKCSRRCALLPELPALLP